MESQHLNAQPEEIAGMTDEQFRQFVVQFNGLMIERMVAGDLRFQQHQQAIEENTRITREIATKAQTIIDVFALTQKGAQVLTSIGSWANRIARWLQPILMVVGGIWAIVHGHPPRGEE